jgi:hypothetical protein
MVPSTSSFFYEEHLSIPSNIRTLIPLGAIFLCLVWWKILVNEAALFAISITLIATGLTYYGRKARIVVTREGIILDGVVKMAPLLLENVTKLTIVEKRKGAFYQVPEATLLPIKALTLPFSIPSYLLMHKGVLIERTDAKIPVVFLPSTNPERLMKAIEDARRW